ncbi:DUF6332 family protein [Streptomyces sp. NPDC058623]|uniref:DUF6332 family protein n=1 Tax=Streptomyces sp. NPDC058623 TaxID=3346563 RepID=UPI003648920B
MGQRTQAERDAVTVEIGYAFVSACFVAALVFGLVYGAAPVLDLSPAAHRTLTVAAGALASVAFLARVTHVLWRFGHRRRQDVRDPSET